MGDAGLREVKNPSALFLNDRGERAAGRGGVRRHRGLAPGAGGVPGPGRALGLRHAAPRRGRLGLRAAGHGAGGAGGALRPRLGDRDVYLNVAGGLRITEPAADLAAAAALASSALDQALPQDCVVFGEISLSGEVRAVSRMEARLKEAAKLGFRRALAPAARRHGTAPRRRSPGVSAPGPRRRGASATERWDLDRGRRDASSTSIVLALLGDLRPPSASSRGAVRE